MTSRNDELPGLRERKSVRQVVDSNQSEILSRSERSGSLILQPKAPPGGRGCVEHYYHFLFDLLLPLSRLLQNCQTNIEFQIHEFGPYTDYLRLVYGDRVRILPREKGKMPASTISLLGMNPFKVSVSPQEIESFRETIFDRLKINKNPDIDRVLLIERMPPQSYFIEQAVLPGAGAQRRSIPNQEELITRIRDMTGKSYRFKNVCLETMGFKEQLRLFSESRVIIGQHGAGLGNVVWMARKKAVLEITPYGDRFHFRVLSQLKDHRYVEFKSEGEHALVDVDTMAQSLDPLLDRKNRRLFNFKKVVKV